MPQERFEHGDRPTSKMLTLEDLRGLAQVFIEGGNQARARAVNAERDRSDRAGGFAAPLDTTLDGALRTVLTALFVGMNSQDWTCIAEATHPPTVRVATAGESSE